MKPVPKSMIFIVLGLMVLGFCASLGGGIYLAMDAQKKILAEEAERLALEKAAKPPEENHAEESHSEATNLKEGEITPQKLLIAAEEKRARQMIKDLEAGKAELDVKRKELLALDENLRQREELLKKEKEALEKNRQRILDMQKKLEGKLLVIDEVEANNYQQLAVLYSTMKQEEAANLIWQMSDVEKVKLLSAMKPKKSAFFIEFWSQKYPDNREHLAKLTGLMRMLVSDQEIKEKQATDPAANNATE